MALDERSRHELYVRLEAILGPEQATTLMEHLPPTGWADVATTRDIDMVLTKFDAVDARFAEVDRRFEEVDRRFDAVDARFEEVDRRFDAVDARFEEVDRRFDLVESNIRLDIRAENASLRADLVGQMAAQTRTVVFSMIGVATTVAGVVLAATTLG